MPNHAAPCQPFIINSFGAQKIAYPPSLSTPVCIASLLDWLHLLPAAFLADVLQSWHLQHPGVSLQLRLRFHFTAWALRVSLEGLWSCHPLLNSKGPLQPWNRLHEPLTLAWTLPLSHWGRLLFLGDVVWSTRFHGSLLCTVRFTVPVSEVMKRFLPFSSWNRVWLFLAWLFWVTQRQSLTH